MEFPLRLHLPGMGKLVPAGTSRIHKTIMNPLSLLTLLLFFVLYASARLLWSGVETVRAVLWTVNYPRRMRARPDGRAGSA